MAQLVRRIDIDKLVYTLLTSVDEMEILRLSHTLSSLWDSNVQVVEYDGGNAITYTPSMSQVSYMVSLYRPLDTDVVMEHGGAIDANPQTLVATPLLARR